MVNQSEPAKPFLWQGRWRNHLFTFFINSALNDDNWYFITPVSCSLSLSLPCWLWVATGGTVWVAAPGPRVGSILLSPPNPSNATAVDDGPPVYSCFTAKGSSTPTRCTEKAASRDPVAPVAWGGFPLFQEAARNCHLLLNQLTQFKYLSC